MQVFFVGYENANTALLQLEIQGLDTALTYHRMQN